MAATTFLVLSAVLLISLHFATRVEATNLTITRRTISFDRQARECKECTGTGCARAGLANQLLAMRGRAPGGLYRTFYDNIATEAAVFRVLVDQADASAVQFSLQNTRGTFLDSRPTNPNQHKIYRFIITDADAVEHSYYYYLDGYDKCSGSIPNPANIEGRVLMSLSVGDRANS